ncbi:MAG: hypothetical protein IT326_01530 [Anaerolineae bacterium]|nr:hypothetical protein [Anaerolineae bacterium]
MRSIWKWLAENWRWGSFVRGFFLVLLAGGFLIAVPGARPDTSSESFRTLGITHPYLFDFVAWEADALVDKASTAAAAPYAYMSSTERVLYVRGYLESIRQVRELERQIDTLYVDPTEQNPDEASASLRAERDALRLEMTGRQALAEAIIESQVSEVLTEYGYGREVFILPPVAMRFTRPPLLMIVSPRDHIERTGAYALEYGLPVERQQALESEVDAGLGVSSLVVPIGGLAVYPAMMIERSDPAVVYEIAAHEWTHHYLTFYPLGFNYGTSRELITINETVASIVGKEIGWAVLDRYYPELGAAPPDWAPQPSEGAPAPGALEAPAFDFRAEMHETRVRVDNLLAQGKIDEAEAYMEARRAVFVENGYMIRRLNQAYFAFYGSYADQPGATGADPIGPALRGLRYYSPSLKAFTDTVRGLTTLAQIEDALQAAKLRAEEREAGG